MTTSALGAHLSLKFNIKRPHDRISLPTEFPLGVYITRTGCCEFLYEAYVVEFVHKYCSTLLLDSYRFVQLPVRRQEKR